MNTPAKKLLAMLEGEVESLPAEEVRGDLASLGVDPSSAVAFARALAGSTGSPGGQLLGAIDAAEDAEAEIARIEYAEIGDIRSQIPEGTAAAIAAEARRKAGVEGNVVGITRRRSRVLRWGGPVAGIAASLLLVFVAGQSYLFNESAYQDIAMLESEPAPAKRAFERQEEAPAADAVMEDRIAKLAMPDSAGRRDQTVGGAGGKVRESVTPEQVREKSADKSLGDADDSRESAVATEPARELESTVGLLAKQEKPIAAAPPPAASAPMPAEGFSANADDEKKFDGGAGVAAKPAPATRLFSGGERAETDVLARARGNEARIAAVYYVDWRQAPASMQNEVLPIGGLDGRLEEARMLAGDRPVIALYTVEGSAGRQDYAQVPLLPAIGQQMPAPAPLTGLLGPEAARFDFIALP